MLCIVVERLSDMHRPPAESRVLKADWWIMTVNCLVSWILAPSRLCNNLPRLQQSMSARIFRNHKHPNIWSTVWKTQYAEVDSHRPAHPSSVAAQPQSVSLILDPLLQQLTLRHCKRYTSESVCVCVRCLPAWCRLSHLPYHRSLFLYLWSQL